MQFCVIGMMFVIFLFTLIKLCIPVASHFDSPITCCVEMWDSQEGRNIEQSTPKCMSLINQQ